MAKYNVDDAWPKDEPTSVEDCLRELVRLPLSGNPVECHGQHRLLWGFGCSDKRSCIRSSFDIRFFNKNNENKHPKEVEKHLLQSFVEKAYPHFPPEACRVIDVADLRWNKRYNTGTLFVGRHFGLPTRCVDWTRDPFIALFFACRKDFEQPGVVWRMDYDDFSNAIARQWPLVYGKKKNIQDDFEKDFTEEKDRDVLTRFHYNCLLDRPIKQNAHIILSGQYDVDHDEAICRLGVQKCRRIVISSNMKFDLLAKLNRWGINSTTLGIEDSNVDIIAAHLADNILGKNIGG
jgi:FRG domain